MISVRNVHRFFGDKHVLNDVSFDIRPGLMTGFVGGNGAGKTTTMRIILGVLAANEGQVLVDGQPMNAEQRATIGYMPEERGLYPKMKVIVVNEAIPGTSEAFRRVREKRPDILLLAGTAQEDPAVITAAADLAIIPDDISRGYTIPLGAQKMGAKTFVHISFPRHMSYETLGRRRAIMEEACKDLGIKFVFETAPDPTSDVGVAGAQQFILEKMPAWLEKYGKDTAFFCTNDAHTEPLLKRIAELGGYFVEADLPSPLMGYPGALGIDLSQERGDWPAILKKVEEAVEKAGGKGRMGTWAYSYGYTSSAALAEYGKRIVEGKAKSGNLKDLIACYNEFTPGAKWNASYYTDAGTGVRNKKFVLVQQDTYVFGTGYLNVAETEVPEKFFKISK